MRIFLGLLAAAALALGNAAIAQEPQASAPPNTPQNEATPDHGDVLATIVQSGSTNTRGYRVLLHADGSATVFAGGPPRLRTSLDSAPNANEQNFPAGFIDAKALLRLLKEIGDVSRIPTGGCAKSASFGTRTQIIYAGKTSGDLQCIRQPADSSSVPSLEQSQRLAKQVRAILDKVRSEKSKAEKPGSEGGKQ
jgi:hypothetical protein